MRCIIPLLGVLLLLPGNTCGQSGPPTDGEQQRHRMVVRGERTLRLLETYNQLQEDADLAALRELPAGYSGPFVSGVSEARQNLEEAAGILIPTNRGAGMRPRLHELALLTRVAQGEALEAVRSNHLAQFADSIDLQVVPGAFRVSESEDKQREKLSVFVYGLYPTSFSGQVTMTLIWIAPDGEERVARRESFPSSLAKQPGITFFVDAPRSAAGSWSMVMEVEYEGRKVRGVPVDVQCVYRHEELSEELRERGLRSLGLAPGALVKAVDSKPFEGLAGVRFDGGEDEEESTVYVLLAPFGEPASLPFAGKLGEALVEHARSRRETRTKKPVISLAVTKADAEAFAGGLKALRKEDPDREIVVIARGDAVTTLALVSSKHHLDMDRAVLVSERVPIPPSLNHVALEVWATEEAHVPEGSQVITMQLNGPSFLHEAELGRWHFGPSLRDTFDLMKEAR